MYSRPPQCSPLFRAKMLGGWVAARSSATEGLGERADTLPHPLLVEREVLEHGVAVGTGRGRVQHRLRELVGRQPEVGDGARQAVVGEACVERTEQLGVVAQERREEARHPRELAVAGRAREEMVDGVDDLVLAAAART